MSKPEYYDVLGLAKGAAADEVKRVFLRLSMRYHPDRLMNKPQEEKDAAEKKFALIVEANNVLSDPAKKAAYDSGGHAALERLANGAPSSSEPDYANINANAPQVPRRRASAEEALDYFGGLLDNDKEQAPKPTGTSGYSREEERRKRREERDRARGDRPNANASTDFADVAQKVGDAMDKLSTSGMAEVPLEALEKFRENLEDFTKVVDQAIAKARKDGPRI